MKKLLLILLCVPLIFSCRENEKKKEKENEKQGNSILIESGKRGLLYSEKEGLDAKTIYKEGKHIINNDEKMIIYDVKTQTLAYRVDGKDKAQVQCALAMNVIYHPKETEIGHLENKIGPDYVNKLIKPKLEDIALTVIKQFDYQQIIAEKKDSVKLLIQKKMQDEMSSRHIVIEEILISDIIISEKIEAAIIRVVEAEQSYLEQKYVKHRAQEEREIRLIEAETIKRWEETTGKDYKEYYSEDSKID